MSRTFIALEIPITARTELYSRREEIFDSKYLRWEPIEKIHLTMKFLGDTTSNQISEISTALLHFESLGLLPLEITQFGVFKRSNTPTILWAGLSQTSALTSLYQKIEDSLAGLGFVKEIRGFNPHLTILRIKPGSDTSFINSFSGASPLNIPFQAKKLTFYESILKPSGSVYQPLTSVNL
ncbi:MAG: RNA 2',3'-cyclic phosphodiesterase [Ignavibacteria bacterium]|nr:RNA 2',3'-cyclic phosphodiesterase [Ignavibacteria bacterium]